MNLGWKSKMTSRQTKYGLNSLLYALAGIAIVIVINLIAARAPTQIGGMNFDWRWDLTSNQRFSLSQQSVQILAGLDRDVELVYFARQAELIGMRDLLEQYTAQSRRVSATYYDLDREPNEATRLNVTEYGTVVVASGDRSELAGGVREEDITNAMIRLLKEEAKVVYFLQGHGERQIDSTERRGYSEVKTAVEEINYEVRTLSLLEETPTIPGDASVLVVAAPQTEFLDPEIAAIKEYMMKGGRVFFLISPQTPAKLVSLLGEFGADISNTLVVDMSGIGKLFGTDELMPLALEYEDHAITKDMANVATMFPFSNAVRATSDYMPGAEFRLLAKTASQTWATRDVESREVSFQEGRDLEGPLALAGAGSFHDVNDPGAPQGRFVVSGSADLASNAILGFNGNRDLFLNSMNWLSSDEDLISIRPTDPEDRRVDLTPGQLSFIFYFSLVFVPLAVIGTGLGVWWKRRG